MKIRVAAAFLSLICAIAAVCAPAAATPGSISYFGATSSGNISYVVTDMSQTRKPGTPASYGYLLSVTTGPLGGTITLTAPAIVGTTGAIPRNAFWASCTATSDPGGIFTSSGVVQLSSSAVKCGTIGTNKSNSLFFSVNLFLDDTSGATAFPADAGYTPAALSVIANAP